MALTRNGAALTFAQQIDTCSGIGAMFAGGVRTDATKFPKFAQKFHAVLAASPGTRAKIAVVDDSTGAGEGAGNGSSLAAAFAYCWPSYLKRLLSARGVAATTASRFGDQGNSAAGTAIETYDLRMSALPSGWKWEDAQSVTAGGRMLKCMGTTANVVSFTPAEQFDTVDVYYIAFASNGSFKLNLDGGTDTTVDTSVGSLIQKATITGSLGTHTLNFKGVVGAASYILGWDCYNSQTPEVSILNMARRSATTGDFIYDSVTSWRGEQVLKAVAPDLTIIKSGINDALLGVSPATTTSNVQSLIDIGRLSGDVLVITPIPAGSSFTSVSGQDATIDAIRAAAESRNAPLFDLYAKRGPYASRATSLDYYWDAIHQRKHGYMDIARAVDRILAQI